MWRRRAMPAGRARASRHSSGESRLQSRFSRKRCEAHRIARGPRFDPLRQLGTSRGESHDCTGFPRLRGTYALCSWRSGSRVGEGRRRSGVTAPAHERVGCSALPGASVSVGRGSANGRFLECRGLLVHNSATAKLLCVWRRTRSRSSALRCRTGFNSAADIHYLMWRRRCRPGDSEVGNQDRWAQSRGIAYHHESARCRSPALVNHGHRQDIGGRLRSFAGATAPAAHSENGRRLYAFLDTEP